MTSKPSAATDDWEDLADDAYSVVSMPSSDEDEPILVPEIKASSPTSIPSTKPPATPSLVAAPSTTVNPSSVAALSSASQSTRQIEESQPPQPPKIRLVGKNAQQPKPLTPARDVPVRHVSPPLPSIEPNTEEESSEEVIAANAVKKLSDQLRKTMVIADSAIDDGSEDAVEKHDPNDYVQVHQKLSNAVNQLINLVQPQIYESNQKSVEKIGAICELLKARLESLEPIFNGYAQSWNAENPWTYRSTPSGVHIQPPALAREIPLDPGLYAWMGELKSRIDDATGAMNEMLDEKDIRPIHFNMGTGALVDLLSDHEAQIRDLVPLLQTDFEEYQAKLTPSFPRFEPRPGQSSSHRDRHRQLVTPSFAQHLPQLSTEITDLTNEVLSLLECLNNHRGDVQPGRVDDVSNLIESFGSLFNALSLLLGTYGSHWSEGDVTYTQPGSLSYSEFCSLDPAAIQEIRQRIRAICNKPNTTSIDLAHFVHGAQENFQRYRSFMVLDDLKLDLLKDLESILTALLVPATF